MRIDLKFDGVQLTPRNSSFLFKVTTPVVKLLLVKFDDDIDMEFNVSVDFPTVAHYSSYAYGNELTFRILGFGIYLWRGRF